MLQQVLTLFRSTSIRQRQKVQMGGKLIKLLLLILSALFLRRAYRVMFLFLVDGFPAIYFTVDSPTPFIISTVKEKTVQGGNP
jgi:hypothetical protein